MAPKRLNQEAEEYRLEILRGVTCALSFTYTDDIGQPINLTGKSIVVKIKDVFGDLLTITDEADDYGSLVTITDAVNGEFNFLITDEQTTLAELTTGRWWIELHDTGNIFLLVKGTAVSQDI